jgi:hypothetical protein
VVRLGIIDPAIAHRSRYPIDHEPAEPRVFRDGRVGIEQDRGESVSSIAL